MYTAGWKCKRHRRRRRRFDMRAPVAIPFRRCCSILWISCGIFDARLRNPLSRNTIPSPIHLHSPIHGHSVTCTHMTSNFRSKDRFPFDWCGCEQRRRPQHRRPPSSSAPSVTWDHLKLLPEKQLHCSHTLPKRSLPLPCKLLTTMHLQPSWFTLPTHACVSFNRH